MFVKAKMKIWVAIIIICGIVYKVPDVISYVTRDIPTVEYSIGIDIDDVSLKNRVAGQIIDQKDCQIKLSVKNSNQDFIITESNNETMYPGYEKLEGYLYTPLIMLINNNVTNYNDNLSKVYQDSGSAYVKDIRYLLQAIEADKTWKDIGFDESLIGKEEDMVKFILPNEYDNTYSVIKDYFVMALNDFKVPSEKELEGLRLRADAIIAKCDTREDISGMFKGNEIQKGIFLYRESVISECLKEFENGFMYFPDYIEVSPGKTIEIKYDVYVKKDKVDEVKGFLQSVAFLEIFGMRNIDNTNVTQSKSYEKCFKVIDSVDSDMSLQK